MGSKGSSTIYEHSQYAGSQRHDQLVYHGIALATMFMGREKKMRGCHDRNSSIDAAASASRDVRTANASQIRATQCLPNYRHDGVI
jgi:hypothetical protein